MNKVALLSNSVKGMKCNRGLEFQAESSDFAQRVPNQLGFVQVVNEASHDDLGSTLPLHSLIAIGTCVLYRR